MVLLCGIPQDILKYCINGPLVVVNDQNM